MTFYITDLDYPWNTIASFPNFTIAETVSALERDPSYDENCIPMTADERKRFMKALHKSGETQSGREIYESMKHSFMYQKYLDGELVDIEPSYSFWVTGAFDTYTAVYAVGADTVGSYDFNLTRLAKKIGERSFYQFSINKGKRLRTFSELIKYLDSCGINDIDFTADDLIDACKRDRYFIIRK